MERPATQMPATPRQTPSPSLRERARLAGLLGLLIALLVACGGSEERPDPAAAASASGDGEMTRAEEFQKLGVVTRRQELPPEMRAFAIRLLGRYGDFPESVDVVAYHLQAPESMIVVAAIDALRQIGNPDAVAALQGVTSHADASVAIAAQQALVGLEPTP